MLGGIGIVAALAAMSVLPAAANAAGAQSSSTQVKQVRVFKVADHVKVDVTVLHPDGKAHKPSRKARNTGTARITLRAADGAVLATDSARAALPVDVPGARSVQQTYRFALDGAAEQSVAAVATVRVEAVADSRLDLDGSGGDPADTDSDTDASDVPVEDLDAAPIAWQYHDILFSTGPFCSVDQDDCQDSYDRNHPGSSPFAGTGGRIVITPTGGQTTIRFSENVLDSWVQGKVPSLASNRFEITDGTVPSWGKGRVTSAAQAAGDPGKVGGPLNLDVSSIALGHRWHVWGYVTTAG
ncbi:MAG: hypothetical protein JWP17_1664 [Solirubrobacterales bacterium]|nr:hypothetical protein [Solirubrobacterales bacterium]